MTEQANNPDDAAEPRFPRPLAQDLARLHPAPGPVPPEVDEAILAAARGHWAVRYRRRLIYRLAPIAAAAAAIALVARVTFWQDHSESEHPRTAVAAISQDIDANGRVDILDAFTLAKRIETGRALPPQWDFNGDTRIDRHDVDAIALAAVTLDKGTLR